MEPKNSRAYAERGAVLMATQEYGKALKDCGEAIRLNPTDAEPFCTRGMVYRRTRRYAAAVEDFEKAISLCDKSQLMTKPYTELASLLATCPEAAVRDGKRSIKLATTACEMLGWTEFFGEGFECLAAAYAEDGQFDKAVNYQRKALATFTPNPPNPTRRDQCRQRLMSYLQKEPHRGDY